MVIAPAINTGTFGVAPQDVREASATVTVGQQLGASIGTSLRCGPLGQTRMPSPADDQVTTAQAKAGPAPA